MVTATGALPGHLEIQTMKSIISRQKIDNLINRIAYRPVFRQLQIMEKLPKAFRPQPSVIVLQQTPLKLLILD